MLDLGDSYGPAQPIGQQPRPPTHPDVYHAVSRLHIEKYNDRLVEQTIIEAKRIGTWTRFIKHSCNANTTVANRRVSEIRTKGLVRRTGRKSRRGKMKRGILEERRRSFWQSAKRLIVFLCGPSTAWLWAGSSYPSATNK